MKISCVIHTYNSERFLTQVLTSVTWVDELVIVDMHSTDRTLEIAKQFNAKVVFHDFVGYADPARQFGLSQCTGDWIIALDSDEVVPTRLKEKIQKVIAEDSHDVMELSFRNFFFGRELKGSGWGYKDLRVKRVFRKGFVTYGKEVHNFLHVKPDARLFQNIKYEESVIHFNYNSVRHFIEKLNRYTDLESTKIENRGQPCARILFHFVREVCGRFFIKQGFRDGWLGLYLSMAMAFYRASAIAKANLPSENEAIEIYQRMKNS